MPSGRYWSPCCWFPPNEDRSTEPTCATSSTRCSTSRTPGANGVSRPMSSVPGPEFGPSFVGGRGMERGPVFLSRCTPRRALLWRCVAQHGHDTRLPTAPRKGIRCRLCMMLPSSIVAVYLTSVMDFLETYRTSHRAWRPRTVAETPRPTRDGQTPKVLL
jgi:hypothetical protein